MPPLIAEDDSEAAPLLWNSTALAISSILAYPKGRSALARAHRLSRLDKGTYRPSLAVANEKRRLECPTLGARPLATAIEQQIFGISKKYGQQHLTFGN